MNDWGKYEERIAQINKLKMCFKEATKLAIENQLIKLNVKK